MAVQDAVFEGPENPPAPRDGGWVDVKKDDKPNTNGVKTDGELIKTPSNGSE